MRGLLVDHLYTSDDDIIEFDAPDEAGEFQIEFDAPDEAGEFQCVEADDDEEDPDELADPLEAYMTPQPGADGVSPRWPAKLRLLLLGSLDGGDPASRTGLLAGVAPMLLHRSQSSHVERPARVVAIYHELFEQQLVSRARLVPARLASDEDLCLVHERRLVRRATGSYSADEDAVAALGLDGDTYFSAAASGYAARLSAGSVVELATRIAQGELRNALAVTRPPGHHCEQNQAMGFCLLNNVPVAVAAVRQRLGVRRALVVDWDVHHGNGVQHMFEDDATVLYISLHRYGFGFYPGTGAPDEVGGSYGGASAARGKTVNVGFRLPGMGDAEYRHAFERVVMPIAREFDPDFVFVSAGFDAALGDPLGGMRLSPAGYAYMTAQLCTLASGRVLVALEGGYNLRSISRSACAVMRVLLGDAPPPLAADEPHPAAKLDVDATLRAHVPWWRCAAAQVAAQTAVARAPVNVAKPLTSHPRMTARAHTIRRRKRGPKAWWWRRAAPWRMRQLFV